MTDLDDVHALLDEQGIAYTDGDDITAATDTATDTTRVFVNGVLVIDTAAPAATPGEDLGDSPA